MSKKATKALNNPYYIARYNASKNNPNLTSREKTAEILNIDRMLDEMIESTKK
jgi:hypothetical protein